MMGQQTACSADGLESSLNLMNSFIIFGAGKKGKALLSHLGESNVSCFCDNHLAGETVDGKEVIAFDAMISLSEHQTVLLSTDSNEMRKQLRDAGISYCDCSETYDPLRELLRKDYEFCPDSEVEFYLVDSFEISHSLPIYVALREAGIRAVMVAEPALFNTAGKWFDDNKAWEILDSEGIEWYKCSNPQAAIAFTTQFEYNIGHYRGKKIKLCYGVSILKNKAFELKAEVTDPFDHVFVVGEFYRKMIARNKPPEAVTDISYLRYKEYFAHLVEKRSILEKLGIRTDKPILVYYPTWDEHSSIHDYAVEIGKLRDEFFVVAKPHHCTLRLEEKAEDRKLLKDNSDLVVEMVGDLSELAAITDLAICDAMSGAMCEVAFLNRKAHMLAIMESGTREEFYVDPGQIAVTVDSPSDLGECAIRLKSYDPKLASRDQQVSEFLSDDFDAGKERCIDVIRNLL